MADVFLQTIFDEVRQALDAGDADLAIGMAHHIQQYAPAMIEGQRMLGEAYLHAGQFAPAITAFEAALRADPENIAAYYGLGLAHQNLYRPDEAIRAFERALEIQPNLAELRTQLLRLYAETPDSAGQFRLSRSGLGRLYARGQMYSQAIDEFYAVLDNEPDRDDVRVALAETLWRDGQEDEAVDWCRTTIARRPDLHKPTLILGYLLLAAGQPEGEALWRKAAAQEPTLAVAQMLFDVLPPTQIDEPAIPPFDEQSWRAAREQARIREQQIAAAPVAPQVYGGSDADAPAMTPDAQPVTTPMPQDNTSLSDNDLLASLLGFEPDVFADDQPDVDEPITALDRFDATPAEETRVGGARTYPYTPFTPTSNDQTALAETAPGTDDTDLRSIRNRSADEQSYVTQVFEHDDVGTEAEPFPFGERLDTATGASFGRVEPFTLDWELTDDEAQTAEATTPAASAAEQTFEFSALKPFSLDDLTTDEAHPATPPANDRAEEMFEPSPYISSDQDIPANQAVNDITDWTTSDSDEPLPETTDEYASFSLRDLGLNEADIDDVAPEPHAVVEQPPVSGEDTTSTDEPALPSPSEQDISGEPDSFALESSLDDWLNGLDTPTVPTPEPMVADAETSAEQPSELVPLSLADLGLDDEVATVPTETPEPKPFSLADLGLDDEPPARVDAPSEPTPFSLDDLGQNNESVSYPYTASSATPFSLSDPELDDEPATINHGAAGLKPFSLADLGLDEDDFAPEPQPQTVDSPERIAWELSPTLERTDDTTWEPSTTSEATTSTPFSLADLGLTEEELERWELQANSDASANNDTPYAPYSAGTTDEEEMTPFSLADLGLTDEDLERFGSDVSDASSPRSDDQELPETNDQADETPFSLADFGLDEDGIAAFGSEGDPKQAEEATAAENPSIHTAETQPFDVAQILAATDSAAEPEQELEVPEDLRRFYEQLDVQPENHAMRLALARMNERQGNTEQAIAQYKQLIQRGVLLDPVVEDLAELTGGSYDRGLLRRLHRLLGDAYMQQNRMEEAMAEYSWT